MSLASEQQATSVHSNHIAITPTHTSYLWIEGIWPFAEQHRRFVQTGMYGCDIDSLKSGWPDLAGLHAGVI